MCGRYSALTEEEIIEIREVIREVSLRIAADELGVGDVPDGAARRGEVFPTDVAPVIIGAGDAAVSFENLRWGFKKWDGKGVIINARSETVETKGMFKHLLAVGRCVVPAGEYYEWKAEGKKKVKHFIKDAAGHILFMAGLYRDTPDGREFVILTKEAVGGAEKIHDRMPVLLRANQMEDWLGGTLPIDVVVEPDFNVMVVPCVPDAPAADGFMQMTLH